MNRNVGTCLWLCVMTVVGALLLAGTILTRGPSIRAHFETTPRCHAARGAGVRVVFTV